MKIGIHKYLIAKNMFMLLLFCNCNASTSIPKYIYNVDKLRQSLADQHLFFSFFKSIIGREIVVELKNDMCLCGTLSSVDHYLNIKLSDISISNAEKYPHMYAVRNCFIRGSVVRYVQLPADEVDTNILQDAARKEATMPRN